MISLILGPSIKWTGHMRIPKKLRNHEKKEFSSSEEDVQIEFNESDDSEYNVWDDIEERVEDYEEPKTNGKLELGNFILVNFKGGKRMATTYKYLCIIDEVDEEEGELRVTSLKCVDSSKTLFTLNDNDKSDIPHEDAIGVVSEPRIVLKGERIYYKFDKPIDVFEKA